MLQRAAISSSRGSSLPGTEPESLTSAALAAPYHCHLGNPRKSRICLMYLRNFCMSLFRHVYLEFFFFQWRVVVYKNDFTRVALSSFSIFLFLWQFLFISVLKDTEDRSAFKVRHQSFELRKNTLNWIMVFTLRLKQVNFHFYSYCSHLPLCYLHNHKSK